MEKRNRRSALTALLQPLFFAGAALFILNPARADFTVPIRNGSSIHFVWVGDLNGDGKPDYVVDRNTSNPQKIEAYTDNGTFLWEVNFGPNSANQDNIEPGSATIDVGHWDGVTVSDLNNDGRAEVIIKIANGVRFGNGEVWTHSDNNRQWIAVLEGSTGRRLNYAAIPTDYIADGPMGCQLGVGNAGITASMKNRKNDGSFNMMVVCYQWNGGSLTQRWKWLRGSQNCPDGHQMRICDVNADGTDDFCQIGFVLNGTNGSILYTLGTQGVVHGDRFHIAKMDNSRTGLQGWGVQQNNASGLLEYYYDARNGTMLWKHNGAVSDVGRGDVGDIDPRYAGYEAWSFHGIYNARSNTKITSEPTRPYPSLRLWWDTDDLSESYNDGKIEKWNYSTSTVSRLVTTWNYESAVSGDRGAPMFYGDFLGDWREEVVLVNSSFNKLVVFTPPGTSNTRGTLRNDRYYKNCLTIKGYMQSHHTSFYIGL
jgi:rhamnogalacturonan endolyase